MREGAQLARHRRRLLTIAVLDGVSWGSVCWLVVGSSPTDATATKMEWICSYDASSPSSVACSCPKTPYSIPAGLVGTGDYVVVANVTYGYKPTLFDVTMKKYYAGGSGGVYTMKETVYLKPRSLAPQLVIGNAPACGF